MMKNRILFVDDEPRTFDSLQRLLRDQQHVWETTFLENSCTARQQLLDTEFDAVVSDVKMPGIDGLKLLRRIRQSEQTHDMPVVILTGLQEQNMKRKALSIIRDDVTRHFDPDVYAAFANTLEEIRTIGEELSDNSDAVGTSTPLVA